MGLPMHKILIVDDESNILFLLERSITLLSCPNIQISKASNGKEALEKIQEDRPDLIFLDAMMPLVDGYEVCRTVKKDFGSSVYIIMLTANAQEIDRIRAMDSGTDEFMIKPFDPNVIIEKVRTLFKINE